MSCDATSCPCECLPGCLHGCMCVTVACVCVCVCVLPEHPTRKRAHARARTPACKPAHARVCSTCVRAYSYANACTRCARTRTLRASISRRLGLAARGRSAAARDAPTSSRPRGRGRCGGRSPTAGPIGLGRQTGALVSSSLRRIRDKRETLASTWIHLRRQSTTRVCPWSSGRPPLFVV